MTNDAKQKIYTEVEDYFFNQFKVSGKDSDAEFQNEKITSDEKTQLNIFLRKLGLETSLIKSTNTKWKTVFNNLSQGQDLLLFSKRLSALGEGDIKEVQDFSKPRVLHPMVRSQYPSGGPKGSSMHF